MGNIITTNVIQINENDLKQLCSNYINDEYINNIIYNTNLLFISLKDYNTNLINLNEFQIISSNSYEQEALKLYFYYSKDGEINLENYIQMCKDLKFLSKHHFTKKSAQAIFKQYCYKKYINYSIFRFKILPVIANSKNFEITDLVIRLSRHEPNLQNNQQNNNNNNNNNNNQVDWKLKENQAALQIQKLQRFRSAKFESSKIKELRTIESKSNLNSPLLSSKIVLSSQSSFSDDTIEEKCYQVFCKFSGLNQEMNIHEFLKLCHDTELIPFGDKIDLTSREAKHLFHRCIALYFNPQSNTYQTGVIHGKRILYEPYRKVLLPSIAEWKGISIDHILLIVSVERSEHTRRHYTREKGPNIISMLSPSYLDNQLQYDKQNNNENENNNDNIIVDQTRNKQEQEQEQEQEQQQQQHQQQE